MPYKGLTWSSIPSLSHISRVHALGASSPIHLSIRESWGPLFYRLDSSCMFQEHFFHLPSFRSWQHFCYYLPKIDRAFLGVFYIWLIFSSISMYQIDSTVLFPSSLNLVVVSWEQSCSRVWIVILMHLFWVLSLKAHILFMHLFWIVLSFKVHILLHSFPFCCRNLIKETNPTLCNSIFFFTLFLGDFWVLEGSIVCCFFQVYQ